LHVAAQALEATWQSAKHVLTVEPHAARIRLHQSKDQAGERRLTAARLAHDAQRLPELDVEGHVVHGAHPRLRAAEHAAAQGEVLAEAPRLEQ
jgi:hypothetical protein